MGKIIVKENIHIIVEPKLNTYIRDPRSAEKDAMSDCESMVRDIKRHIDGVGYVSIGYDEKAYCSHCLSDWEENADTDDPECPVGQPLCCQAAIDEFNNCEEGL